MELLIVSHFSIRDFSSIRCSDRAVVPVLEQHRAKVGDSSMVGGAFCLRRGVLERPFL